MRIELLFGPATETERGNPELTASFVKTPAFFLSLVLLNSWICESSRAQGDKFPAPIGVLLLDVRTKDSLYEEHPFVESMAAAFRKEAAFSSDVFEFQNSKRGVHKIKLEYEGRSEPFLIPLSRVTLNGTIPDTVIVIQVLGARLSSDFPKMDFSFVSWDNRKLTVLNYGFVHLEMDEERDTWTSGAMRIAGHIRANQSSTLTNVKLTTTIPDQKRMAVRLKLGGAMAVHLTHEVSGIQGLVTYEDYGSVAAIADYFQNSPSLICSIELHFLKKHSFVMCGMDLQLESINDNGKMLLRTSEGKPEREVLKIRTIGLGVGYAARLNRGSELYWFVKGLLGLKHYSGVSQYSATRAKLGFSSAISPAIHVGLSGPFGRTPLGYNLETGFQFSNASLTSARVQGRKEPIDADLEDNSLFFSLGVHLDLKW